MIGDAENAFDGADRASDASTDRAANHATDRTSDAIAFMGALFGAADDALRPYELRQRKPCQSKCKNGEGCEGRREALRRTVGKNRRVSLGFQHILSWQLRTMEHGKQSETQMRPNGCSSVTKSIRAAHPELLAGVSRIKRLMGSMSIDHAVENGIRRLGAKRLPASWYDRLTVDLVAKMSTVPRSRALLAPPPPLRMKASYAGTNAGFPT
jgi:hypothetical protein